MSRSYRKRPYYCVYEVESQKEAKRHGNRRLRRNIKQLVDKWAEVDPDLILPIMDEILDVWSMPKDGVNYYEPYNEKEERRWTYPTYKYGRKLTPYKAWFLRVMAK